MTDTNLVRRLYGEITAADIEEIARFIVRIMKFWFLNSTAIICCCSIIPEQTINDIVNKCEKNDFDAVCDGFISHGKFSCKSDKILISSSASAVHKGAH